jgi:hypothetical protein
VQFRDHASVCVFDSGHTIKATATAMAAPHMPQTALTRKMIAVAMHALPGSALRRKEPVD